MASWAHYFDSKNQQKKGLILLILLITAVQIIIAFYPSKPIVQKVSETEQQRVAQLEKDNFTPNFSLTEKSIVDFNPNDLSVAQWMDLGFSERQAEVILKYKKMLGGFRNAQQLQKCFVISAQKFQQLEPFMVFSQHQSSYSHNRYPIDYKNTVYENSIRLYPFNPNNLSVAGWQSLGFSARQAAVIVNYKTGLGGFENASQVQKCFVISAEKFAQLKPYLRFDATLKSIDYHSFNPNSYTENDWVRIGFSPKQAQTILKYKMSIGGFKNAEQLQKCFVISAEKFVEIKPYLVFNGKEKIEKEIVTNDLNQISVYQLQALGIDAKQTQRIVNYRTSKGKITNFEALQEASISEVNIELLKSKLRIQ